MSKFWNFIYNAATDTTEESVELRIQGNFIDSENSWIYEWFGIPVASPNAFRKELKQYENKNITVWIDSYGGSVFAGMGIYNALMEHKRKGAKVKTIADTKVMSAATLPYLAGDERMMSPGAMFMMHNPLTGASGYASDLRKAADILDEVKSAILNIYTSATGIAREKISALMDDETYWGANKTVAEGFATGVLYENDATKINDVMNFTFNRLEIQNAASESIQKFLELAKERNSHTQGTTLQQLDPVLNIDNTVDGGEEEMEIKNTAELKAKYPELVAQVEEGAKNTGATEERQRIQEIEKIANKIDPTLVHNAKFVTPMNAKDLAFEAMQKDADKGQQYLENLKNDVKDSGANNVGAVPEGQIENTRTKTVDDMYMSAGAIFDRKRRGVNNG